MNGRDYRVVFEFLRRLRSHNDREWFKSHKAEWDRVAELSRTVAADIISAVAMVDERAALLDVRDCTYRIYRDTRFSADKTPYKTHIGVFVNPPGGKKSLTCGYYVHLEPGQCMVCGGTIGLPPKVISAIRADIRDNIDEYRSIVESDEFRTLLPQLGENPLKTAPKGFDRDWPWLDYVRPRDFVAASPLPDAFFENSGEPETALLPYFRQIRRFNDFINYTIERFLPGAEPEGPLPVIY